MKNTCGTLIEQVEELSHASGLAQIELVFNQQTSTFPASQTEFTITDLTEGVHQVTLVAIDQAGNRSAPVTKSFEVTFPRAEESIQLPDFESSTSSSTTVLRQTLPSLKIIHQNLKTTHPLIPSQNHLPIL